MLAACPAHGYELATELGRRDSGREAAVSRAQVYYSLKKLLRLKLIRPVKDGSPAAGPEREPYGLTTAGRHAMSRAIAQPEWARERPPIAFQMWLIVLGAAEPDDRAAALRLRKAHLAERIDSELRALERLRQSRDPGAAMNTAIASHTLEVLRLEQQLLTEIEPMLGRTSQP